MPAHLQNAQTLPVKTTALRKAVLQLLKEEAPPRADVSILLIDDDAIREMNRIYRGYDKPTDVLSFSQQESAADTPNIPLPRGVPILLGDVLISVETAVRQAMRHGFSLEQELALLAVHGVLHLLGYEDETLEGSLEMREKERVYLGIQYPIATE